MHDSADPHTFTAFSQPFSCRTGSASAGRATSTTTREACWCRRWTVLLTASQSSTNGATQERRWTRTAFASQRREERVEVHSHSVGTPTKRCTPLSGKPYVVCTPNRALVAVAMVAAWTTCCTQRYIAARPRARQNDDDVQSTPLHTLCFKRKVQAAEHMHQDERARIRTKSTILVD